MIYSVQQIKFDIQAYIKEFGGDFQEWCIGITSHPRQVMRDVHRVDDTQDIWLCKQAISHRACQTVKAYFTEKLSVEGVPSPENEQEGRCILLFRKSSRTAPPSQARPSDPSDIQPDQPHPSLPRW